MKKKLRLLLSGLVLVGTIAVFIRYIQTHPEITKQLEQINPLYIVVLCALYLGVILVLSVINSLSVRLCGKAIGSKESFSLTGTSSLANFFGPLQSGVGIRALYFKAKLKIPIKQYIVMSLYYYGLYAFFSGIFLLFGSAQYRLPLLALLVIGAGGTFYYIRYKTLKNAVNGRYISRQLLIKLAVAVLLQLALITSIYFIELIALGKNITIAQAISYSGAANFSLFVAVTPGAIGIREAFLVVSQHLHGIDSGTIVAANILDRSVYVLFLGGLFLWLVLSHTMVRFNARKVDNDTVKMV